MTGTTERRRFQINTHIRDLPKYNAGLAISRYEDIYGRSCRGKLDSNENPYGPSPSAKAAAKATVENAAFYPDGDAFHLRQALSETTGQDVASLTIGNGSEELIHAVYGAVLKPGDHVLTVTPGFGLHDLAAKRLNIEIRKIPYEANYKSPLTGLIEGLKDNPKLLVISSPSNPLGRALSQSELETIIAAVGPETLFLLDEAYIEYVPESDDSDTLETLRKSDVNWVSLRTFSKAYGLAGLRIGYAICHDETLRDAIRNLTTPFNVNAVALAAAHAALADQDHLNICTTKARQEILRLTKELRALGYNPAESKSNALFFKTGMDAAPLAEKLREVGILVKPWAEDGYTDCLRVSVGTEDQNNAFLQAVKSLGSPPRE